MTENRKKIFSTYLKYTKNKDFLDNNRQTIV